VDRAAGVPLIAAKQYDIYPEYPGGPKASTDLSEEDIYEHLAEITTDFNYRRKVLVVPSPAFNDKEFMARLIPYPCVPEQIEFLYGAVVKRLIQPPGEKSERKEVEKKVPVDLYSFAWQKDIADRLKEGQGHALVIFLQYEDPTDPPLDLSYLYKTCLNLTVAIFHLESGDKCGVYESHGGTARTIKPAVISTSAEFAKKEFKNSEVLLRVAQKALDHYCSGRKEWPVLYHPGCGEFHAYRGVGKTNVVTGYANAWATGGEHLCYESPREFKVLLVDGEMAGGDLQQSMRLLAEENSNFNLIAFEEQDCIPSIASADGQDWLDEAIDRCGAEIIILDSWSMLAKVDSNDETAWQSFQDWEAKTRKRGKSTIYLQHDGKKGLQRGHSKPEDVLNWVVQLKWEGNYKGEEGLRCRQLFDKARRPVGRFGNIRIELSEGGLWTWSFPNQDQPDEQQALPKQGRKKKQISEAQFERIKQFSAAELGNIDKVAKILEVSHGVAERWIEIEKDRRKSAEHSGEYQGDDFV
jgi:AAA domain-containing protein